MDTLRDDIFDFKLRASIAIGLTCGPKVFVKPADWPTLTDEEVADAEESAPALNTWSLYNLHRSVSVCACFCPGFPQCVFVFLAFPLSLIVFLQLLTLPINSIVIDFTCSFGEIYVFLVNHPD